MVTDFLPNMRGLVSHELWRRGISQNRIALLLGITQARVSHYLAKERNTFENRLLREFEIGQQDLQDYAKILADDVTRNRTDGVFTLYSIWKNLLFSGAACTLHRRKSSVSSDCSVCMELHRPPTEGSGISEIESTDSLILRDLRDAVSSIESSIEFPSIMPEVSVNIAMCRPSPKSSRDVAAIPGRINRIHGRAKALISPEFGCSNHMSKVLIIFNSKDEKVRAIMNIKYDEFMDNIIEKLRLPKTFTAESGTSTNDKRKAYGEFRRKDSDSKRERDAVIFANAVNPKEDELLLKLSRTKLRAMSQTKALVVIDRGAEGLEPMTYLLGTKASDVAQLSLRIAHSYSSSLLSRNLA